MEKLNATIVNIKDNVKRVQEWTEESAPKLMKVVESNNISPNERANVSEQLQGQASSNVSLVNEMIENVETLHGWLN